MLVHGMGAGEEMTEIFRPDGDHQGQADGRPHRIAPPTQSQKPKVRSSPMPKAVTLSSAVEIAAKCEATAVSPSFSTIHSRAVLALVIVSMVVKVLDAMRKSVVTGFKFFKSIGNMRPINIGNIMEAWPVMVRRQRQRGHGRAKVRPANADIHHINNFTRPHTFSKFSHGRQHATHIRHHVPARHHHG